MKLNTMKWLVLLGTLMAGSLSSAAQFTLANGPGYKIEPLYGYETVYRSYPTAHIQTRAMYGARLSVGVDALSGELEYAKASDTENYSTAPETVKTETEKAKLGIRSTLRFNEYFFSSGRLGAQASKDVRESTSGGVLTRTEEPIEYNPYAGLSIGVRFGVVSLNVNSTVVFKDYSDMGKNEYQNTFSIAVGY